MNQQSDLERFEELKGLQALFGLSEDERSELMRLSENLPDEPLDDYDLVAAAVDQTLNQQAEDPPEHLRRTLESQATTFFVGNQPSTATLPGSHLVRKNGKSSILRAVPWLLAAACLVVALIPWSGWLSPTLSPSQQRSTLLASGTDLIKAEWAAGPTPVESAGGDIVWSPTLQEGYMRFRNLPVNDPAQQQYQLWIFDRNQDEATPVDGGVFDISSTGQVVVPITAKLRAEDVYLFAVTIEKPGGVVVSSRERLPLLAKID